MNLHRVLVPVVRYQRTIDIHVLAYFQTIDCLFVKNVLTYYHIWGVCGLVFMSAR